MRCLAKDEHRGPEFGTQWSQYDLDDKRRVLLGYATKPTDTPSLIEDGDIDALRAAGWDGEGIYEVTLLIAWFNFNGRLEAAAGSLRGV